MPRHEPKDRRKQHPDRESTKRDRAQSDKNKRRREKKSESDPNYQNKDRRNHQKTRYGPSSILRTTLAQIIATTAVKCTSKLGDDNDHTIHGTAGQFDFYLFAQSWAPRFCCSSPEKCLSERMNGLNDLSTHGLWPTYLAGDKQERTYPAFCTGQPMTSNTRADHEWEKHGTCSGLPRALYFQEETRLANHPIFSNAKKLLVNCSENSISVDDFVQRFGGEKMVALKADRQCRLEEITTCWSKYSDGGVGRQIQCPDHVLASAKIRL